MFKVILRHRKTQSWGSGLTVADALRELRSAAGRSKITVEECILTVTDATAVEFNELDGSILNTKGGSFMVHTYPHGTLTSGEVGTFVRLGPDGAQKLTPSGPALPEPPDGTHWVRTPAGAWVLRTIARGSELGRIWGRAAKQWSWRTSAGDAERKGVDPSLVAAAAALLAALRYNRIIR